VFCRDGVVVSDDLKSIAIQAINALSLDFGAVDIIYNQHENKYYVLEINTAPALAGTTLDSYVSAITKLL
jgi:D-alanine-D-alanine ligase-like ATP-grasp enzyme